MVSAKEAYATMQEQVANNTVFGGSFDRVVIADMAELPDAFVFGMDCIPNCYELSGYYTVDKSSGAVEYIDILDYARAVTSGHVRELDLDSIRS